MEIFLLTWDVSHVTSMVNMFERASSFNQDITGWNTDALLYMYHMFDEASSFNQDIDSVGGHWDVSKVTDMNGLFEDATAFNGDISHWDTSLVEYMNNAFHNAGNFNQDISAWNTSAVTNMEQMFYGASNFNQDLSGWDTSNVTNMISLFYNATVFNGDVSNWDVSNVTNMINTFRRAQAFNGDIHTWDTSSVTDMTRMFFEAGAFNQPINTDTVNGYWDVSSVNNIEGMFYQAGSFNQDLSNWNMSLVTNMSDLFSAATSFDQDLSSWDVDQVTSFVHMFSADTLSTSNYNNLLQNWDAQTLQSGATFDGGHSKYCNVTAHDHLTSATGHNWTITDGGMDTNCSPTITSDGGGATASVNAAENQTAVTTVVATDPNVGDTITYSVSGGADSAKFSINSSTGDLTFASAPDYETPTDTDSNNIYVVEIKASDGTNDDTQTIDVTVTDVTESTGGGGGTVFFPSIGGSSSTGDTEGDTSDDPSIGDTCEEVIYELKVDFDVPSSWFSDVESSHNEYDALMSLASQGVVQGSSDEHLAKLDDTINRAEVSKIVSIAREDKVMLGSSCDDSSSLSDLDIEKWYFGFIKNLEDKGVLNGYPDGTFKPANNMNVAEAYKVLATSFNLITKEEADALSAENDVEWFVPYKDAVEGAITIPSFIETDEGAYISRGDFFYLLNEFI